MRLIRDPSSDLADRFADGVIYFSHWSTSWGLSHVRTTNLAEAAQANPSVAREGFGYGLPIITWWEGMVRSIVGGYGYGFFWCAASAVYLLLRQDVDETEMDVVYRDQKDKPRELPPLKPDAAGVPTMGDAPAAP